MSGYSDRRTERIAEKRHTLLVVLLSACVALSAISAILCGLQEYRFQKMRSEMKKAVKELEKMQRSVPSNFPSR